jgi:hypothetical protein
LSLSRKRENYEWFSSSSDFVFAHRLQKISVRWSGGMDSKEVTGGDLLGHDDFSGSGSEDEVDGLGEIEWVELDRRDLRPPQTRPRRRSEKNPIIKSRFHTFFGHYSCFTILVTFVQGKEAQPCEHLS